MGERLSDELKVGFYSGVLATVPMTLWMLLANRFTPDVLPPEEITHNLAKKTHADQISAPEQRKKASVFNHFLYGGLVGIPFSLVSQNTSARLKLPLGIGYGLLVWAANYLGILPALGLYPKATQEPGRMNGMMIVAHVIWGSVLGVLLGRGSSSQETGAFSH